MLKVWLFWLDLIVTVSSFFPLGIRRCMLFGFLFVCFGGPKRHQDFEENLNFKIIENKDCGAFTVLRCFLL